MIIKLCFKCKVELPITEFYRHGRMKDGHLNKCKQCTKRDVSKHYVDNREKISEYERKRSAAEHRKSKALIYQRNRRSASPEKNRARQMVSRCVRSGILKKTPCSLCGNENVQAHHADYSKPLDVVWVCFKCHREAFHNQTVIVQ